MASLLQDARYCWRTLRQQPLLALVCTATLAVAIGASACILGIAERLLVNPLPYRQAREIFVFQIRDLTSPRPGRPWLTEAEWLDYREQVDAFADAMAVIPQRDIVYAAPQGNVVLSGADVSGNAFTFLGVQPALGRTLTPEDATPGAPKAFVVSYKTWTDWGSDPGAVGRSFVLNGVPTVLVGVMPPRFKLFDADVWQPTMLTHASQRPRYAYMLARLKPGVPARLAQTQIEVVANRLVDAYPTLYPKSRAINVETLPDSLVGRLRPTLYAFVGAIVLLLVIACGNVTSMLLARAGAREHGAAIRAALGATPSALFRLQMVESVMLALVSAVAGCGLAYWGVKLFLAVVPPGLVPADTAIDMSWPFVSIVVGLALLCAGLISVLPLLTRRRSGLAATLQHSTKGASASYRARSSRGVLVGQVALALVLCSSAVLLLRTVVNLQAIDLGVVAEDVQYFRLRFPAPFATAASKQQLVERIFTRLRTLPGVVSVAASSALPLEGGVMTGVDVAGRPPERAGTTLIQLCTEDYLQVTRLPLRQGRFLSGDDVSQSRRVAVINQTFARSYFGDAPPIGKTVRLNILAGLPSGRIDDPMFEVIGVVGDEKNHGIRNPVLPEAYIPAWSTPAFARAIIVRTEPATRALVARVRPEIAVIEPRLVMTEAGSLPGFLRKVSYAEPQFAMAVMGVFAVVAVLLAALGVYGVMAYSVALQRREIGIRMALGATRADMLRLVMIDALRLIVFGLAIGIPVVLVATRLLGTQLWGVSATDPVTLAAVSALMIVTGLMASFFPARWATAVSPRSVLASQ